MLNVNIHLAFRCRKVGEVGMREMIFRTSDDGLVMNNVSEIELVRCKNCRWGEPTKNAYGEDRIICGNDDTYIDRYITVPADWYCADGEKSE